MTTILVVDDEPSIAEMVQAILEDEGYEVVTAGNGQEALARLGKVRPHLVLCDVMMPGMDGRALCRALQADPHYRSIPVVLMSAALPGLGESSIYAAFLSKPFDLTTLIDTIVMVLNRGPTL
jgi:CheY-like chemotaxis protein